MRVTSGSSCIGSWVVAVAVVLAGGLPALGQWQIQPVTAVPSGGSNPTFYATPAITFDNQSRPHVAYMPATSSQVLHAYGNALGMPGVWATFSTPVVPGGITGLPGIVHLAAANSSVYLSGTSCYPSVGYCVSAVFDGTSWATYTIPGFSSIRAVVCGMASDNAGQVNWIFNASSFGIAPGLQVGYDLLRQTGPGSAADALVVPNLVETAITSAPASTNWLGLDGDMVFDAAGNLHTVQYYQVGSQGFLLYTTGPAGGPFTVDTNVDMGWWVKTGRPGIAVDPTGAPHIVYTTLWPYYQLNYLTRTPTGWDREVIDGGGNYAAYVGTFPKVLIDLHGVVHVIYADGLNGQLKHARQGWGTWQIEVIDTIGTQATYSAQVGALAAAMDSVGGIGVVYWNGQDGMLKYAYLAP